MPGVVALHGSRGQVLQVDAVDLVVEVPAVAGGRPGDQHEDECQRPPHPGRGALAGAPLSERRGPGPCRAVFLLGSSWPCAVRVRRFGSPRRSGARARAGPSRRGSRPGPPPGSVAPPLRRSACRAGAGPSGRGRSRALEDSSRSVQIEDVRPDAPVDARVPELAPAWAAGTRRQPSERCSRPAVTLPAGTTRRIGRALRLSATRAAGREPWVTPREPRWKDDGNHGRDQCRPAAVPDLPPGVRSRS